MSDYYSNKKYFVYRHIVPNGKMYIGITSKSSPELRWGVGGKAYSKSNKHFWYAIQKYGWDNIEHIVVAHSLTVDQACNLESYLIYKYNSMQDGYNQTSGGIRPTEITDEIRNKLSIAIKAYHSTLPEGAWSAKFRGHAVSDSAKKKISSKATGRKYSNAVIERRKRTFKEHLTPERRSMYGSFSKGRTVSEETRKKISAANKGRVVSEETRLRIGRKSKERFSVKHIWVHNEINELEIPESKLSEYLSIGYVIGRLNTKSIYLTKCGNTIKVSKYELDTYLSDGWVRGFSNDRCENIKRSKQKFIYTYKGNIFASGKALALYLRNNGYPKIVQGTINLICSGKPVQAYPELSIDILRNPVDENI